MKVLLQGIHCPFEKVPMGMVFSAQVDGAVYIKTYDAHRDRHAATNVATGALCLFADEQELCVMHPHAVLVVTGLPERTP